MAMPLGDALLAERLERGRVRLDCTVERSKPHRAADLRDLPLSVEQAHDRVRRRRIEFGAVGIAEADDVACELDRGTLQTEANAEEGQAGLSGEADRLDLPLDAALVEP